ncbi:MAG TPA: hypothetical protein ENK31_07125 [Nannocystis exedens]|nr:hypothetical protein [Nannocystis exedens]
MFAFGAPGGAEAAEVMIAADSAPRPPEQRQRRVHGEVGMGLSFGFIAEDPIVSFDPVVALDLHDILPLDLRIGGPLRLRLYDRDPAQGTVIRGTDWDEAGDFVAILQRLHYRDSFAFAERGLANIDLRIGGLGRVQLGHGSLVMGYANSLDLDRRRSGVDLQMRLDGYLLERPAGIELGLVIGDLAGGQIFGGRLATDWAGASLGLSVVGDPLAPRQLVLDDSGEGLAIDRQNRPISGGQSGVAALGLDFSYRFTDRWRYLVTPYLDLNLMPGLGKGLHVGVDAELMVGRYHSAHLGIRAEMTVGDSSYDPAYFDVFYGLQRWQAPFVASAAGLPDDVATLALPKRAFVGAHDLGGVGGYGAIRFAHDDGAFVETGYRFRPGPLGHTWETRTGVDLEVVELSLLLAHRGSLGFNVIEPAGTLASFDLRVPVLSYLDVTARAAWLYASRRIPGRTAAAKVESAGFVGGAGLVLVGIAGRFPW